jgi:uncharacterized protein YfdQ (DUF2303 family)
MIQELLNALRVQNFGEQIALPQDHTILPPDFANDVPNTQAAEVQVGTVGSLVDYIGIHRMNPAVFAEPQGCRIVAIMDWHDSLNCTGWGDHRATYEIQKTRQWRDWMAISGKLLSQTEFCEFIEEHLDDIHKPAAADVLSIATNLQGKRNVAFKSVQNLTTGDKQLVWEETTEAKGGARGDAKVPSQIVIRIPVFRGAEETTTFDLTVLLRYRIDDGKLRFEAKILHSEKVTDLAFDRLVTDFQEKVDDVPVYIGSITRGPREISKSRIYRAL